MSRRVGLVWAQTSAGVIGSEGGIPWHVPEDFAHFKEVTLGGTVIMGRRTWDSLPERFRPLPGRRNIVVTRNAAWSAAGAQRAGSLDEALQLAEGDSESGSDRESDSDREGETIWIIGGGELYRAAIADADVLEVTEIDLDVAGDTYAPPVSGWRAASGAWQTSRNGTRYRFATFTRG